ncbi:MAG: hypothetical protein WCF57_20140 [Pyrinomonadaceae bacterium]
MKRTYTHVSNLKSELVTKGWIRRKGRHAVELLVGEFPPPKVRSLVRKNPNEEDASLGKILTSEGASLGKIVTVVRKNPNEASGPPFIYEPGKKPEAAAATAAAPADAWKKELCDESYVAETKLEGIYPHALVDYVWRKLKRRCKQERVEPNKGRFEYWLSIEKGTPVQQPSLLEPPVADARESFQASKPERPLLPPDAQCGTCGGDPDYRNEFDQTCHCRACRFCFDSGMEMVEGKARRCRCRLKAPAARTTGNHESAEPERPDVAAQEEMRRANGN